jgi:hypothetical protein
MFLSENKVEEKTTVVSESTETEVEVVEVVEEDTQVVEETEVSESTETEVVEEETQVSESTEVEYNIFPDEAAMFSVVMESQMEMANLQVSMIRLEHTAVITEDVQLLEAGAAQYFQTAIKVIKELAAKVAAWFKGILQRIGEWISNVQGFLSKYKDRVLSANPENLELVVYGPKALPNFEKAMGAISKFAAIHDLNDKSEGDNVKSELAGSAGSDFSTSYRSALRNGHNEKSKTKIDRSAVADYVKFLQEGVKFRELADAVKSKLSAGFEVTLGFAEKGAHASDESRAEFESKVRAAKKQLDACNLAVSIAVGVQSEAMGEAMRVCKEVLKSAGKSAKVNSKPAGSLEAPKKEEPKEEPKQEEVKEDGKKSESVDDVLAQFGLL